MPDNYISQIDFGDGVIRKLKAEGGGGTGLYIGDVIDFETTFLDGEKQVTLTWTDPNDIVISGVTQAAWAGTVIVRKEGSEPVSSGDGTVVVNSTTRNQYSTNGFVDTNVEFSTVYYYKAFPYTTSGLSTPGSSSSVEILNIKVYGVSWDGTATTAWTRTDAAANFTNPQPYKSGVSSYSSPFDELYPWSEMTTESHTGVGTVVKIPKFWYKITQNGTKGLNIQIADGEKDGFSVSPAHMDRGDGNGERDVIYVGRYHCDSTYKSRTNQNPVRSIKRSSARTSIHALGSTIWQIDFATMFTIWLLYLVEYADWNETTKIGGPRAINYAVNTGGTNNMPYHTGIITEVTQWSMGGMQYRNIEGLWDNVYDWIDGCYYNTSGLNIVLNPTNFDDYSNGVFINSIIAGIPSGFAITNKEGAFPLFTPSESNGTSSTYACDQWSYNKSYPCLHFGGYYNGVGGLFTIGMDTVNNSDSSIGCRLMELPSNA